MINFYIRNQKIRNKSKEWKKETIDNEQNKSKNIMNEWLKWKDGRARRRINNNFPVSSSRGLQTVRRCQYWKSQASWERSNLIRPKYLRKYFLFTIIWIAWPWLDTFPIAIIYKGGSNYNNFYSQVFVKS